MFIKKTLFFFFLLFISFKGFSTNVSGIINADTVLTGSVVISEDLIITGNHQLTIKPGTDVKLKSGASIILKDSSSANIIGTVDSTINFSCLDNGEMWGGIIAQDTACQLNINYANIQNGQVKALAKTKLIFQNSFIHQYFRGSNAIVYTEDADSLYINNIHVSNYYELNFVRTKCLVENSLFEYMIGDAIDFDNSPVGTILRNTTIRYGVGDNIDAVDFGKVNFTGNGSIGLVEKCLIHDISDKGVSVGEGAQYVKIIGNVIYNAGKGVAVKDNSTAEIINNTIYNCKSGIEAVEKNAGLGGGNAYCLRDIIWACDSSILINNTGICLADTCLIEGLQVYPGNNNINTNPLFVDEANYNFNLQSGSPALSPTAGPIDLGALFPVSNKQTDSAYLMLGSPRSGEVLNGDSVLYIHWSVGSSIDSIKIEFYNSTVNQWQTLYNAVDASVGYANWQVPNIYSTQCKLKLTVVGDTINKSETYNFFSILPTDTSTAAKPLFTSQGGYYTSSLMLAMTAEPGATIYYTTDGSEPTDKSSVFNVPFTISPTTISTLFNEVNITSTTKPQAPLSYIRTSPVSHVGPNPCFWMKPSGAIFQSAVIKAMAYVPGKKLSKVETNTYFIDADTISNRYPVPVVSLTTNKENLFDYYKGVFIPGATFNGKAFTGNYELRGRDYEVPFFMEMFEPNGTKIISQNIGIRVKGEWIRNIGQKSLGLYARSEYDKSNEFAYNLFPELNKHNSVIPQTRFKRLVLRNSGNEFPWPWNNSMIRDSYTQRLLNGLNIKNQANRPVVVFLNGEYWGIHNLTEENDARSLENNYFLSADSVVIMEHNLSGHNQLTDGTFGDDQDYLDLVNFVNNNSLSDSINYNQALKKVDEKSLIDMWVSNNFVCKINYDHNTAFWRYKGIPNNKSYGADGRWRWIAADFDISFFLNSASKDFLIETINSPSEYLISEFLKNENFKKKFINRYADLLNSHFNLHETQKQLSLIVNEYAPLIQEHISRWNSPATYNIWQIEQDSIIESVKLRQQKSFEHLMLNFALDTSHVTLNVSNLNAGKVLINTVVIDSLTKGIVNPFAPYPWSGTYFKEVPVEITAIPNPGYKFVKWLENNSTHSTLNVVLQGDSVYTALFEVDSLYYNPTQKLFINEIMSGNITTVYDNYGQAEDWIEIYNSSNDTVDLAGYIFTDGFYSCMVPYGNDSTFIGPKKFKLFWADDQKEQGVLHLNFKLSQLGDKVFFYNPDRNSIADSVSFGPLLQDNSFGRFEDGLLPWVLFDNPTPGASNSPNGMQNKGLEKMILYPNPTSGNCYIRLPENTCYNVSVYDLSGKKVLVTNECNSLIQIDMGNLNTGLYLINVTDGVKHYSVKCYKKSY